MKNQPSLTPEQQKMMASILGDHLSGPTYVAVEVPTQCKWYNIDTIEVRPFTFEDERDVLSPANKNKNFLNLLLSKCVKGIDIGDLFMIDRDFLAYKIKELSTGAQVRMEITCESCSKKSLLEVDLSVLKTKPFDQDLPMETTLPQLKKSIKLMPPRVKDEDFLTNFQLLTSNLWRFIEEIDGVWDETVLNAIVEKLPVTDVHFILKTIGLQDFGLQTGLNYICACQHETEVEVSLTENFFGLT